MFAFFSMSKIDRLRFVRDTFSELVKYYSPESVQSRFGASINLMPVADEGGFSIEYKGAICKIAYSADRKNPNKKYLYFKIIPSKGDSNEIFEVMQETAPKSRNIEHYVRGHTLRRNGEGNIIGRWELRRFPEKSSDFAAFIKGYFLRRFFKALSK